MDRLKKHSCKPGTQQFLRSNKPDAKSATNFSVRTFFFFSCDFLAGCVELNARQNWKFYIWKKKLFGFLFSFSVKQKIYSFGSFDCSFVLIRVSSLFSLILFTDAHSRTLFHLPDSNYNNTVKCSDFSLFRFFRHS